MLIEFKVGNYLSFKDVVTFSMVAANMKQHADTHVFEANGYELLKSSAIYGANASGKSNLFKAMGFAKKFIISSSKDTQAKEEIEVEKFALSTETDNEPSLFEFTFLTDGFKYRYGFRANKDVIVDEWLFQSKKVKEKMLFERHHQNIKVPEYFAEGKGLETKTRKNALFLSVVAQFNGPIAESIIEWLGGFFALSGLDEHTPITVFLLKNNKLRSKFLDILKIADLAIEDFKIIYKELNTLSKEVQLRLEKISTEKKIELFPEIKTIHNKFNDNNELNSTIEFDLKQNESKGTQNLFSILGYILFALDNGLILFIDEFDVNLHPLITIFLVKMFNSNKHNPKNAQIVFNTHDTNLLNKDLFRRDQIWFTEKDKYGATDLYSLADYEFPEENGKKVRYDRSFEKDYLTGKYGAIPFIGAYDFFCEEDSEAI
jgi:uncharacterized protein